VPDEVRPSPDALLAAIHRGEKQRHRGRLKVFLGMSPGVGKTFAMLEAARREREGGRDVVVAYVETHGRRETEALALGLPQVPRRMLEHRGVSLSEMDLDAVLARRPSLALVDELAHTNAPGSRHPKRWQDVVELLDAGIDVFTTLNVQHVESRTGAVREITGVAQSETVPDSVLDGAGIELIDLPPAELLRRLAEGKVYGAERAKEAAEGFFREGNLTALREIALRFTAEHVGNETRLFVSSHSLPGVWKTGQRLLVAVSPSPSSGSLVRWVRRVADALDAPWLAVYVDTGVALSADARERLRIHLELARELGAEVVTAADPDVVSGVLRVARQHNVTQIVAGKPAGWLALDLLRGGSVLNRLIRGSGNIDVLCVRADPDAPVPSGVPGLRLPVGSLSQYGMAAGGVAAVTLLNLLVSPLTGYYAPSFLYLSSVVVGALFLPRGPVLFAATISALAWNYLFLPPVHTFVIGSFQDALLFALFFVVALAMGQVTSRLRAQQAAERSREERATALYLLTREIAAGRELPDVLAVAVRQLGQTFGAEVAILLADTEEPGRLVPYPFGTLGLAEKELGVADWAFRNGRPAGRSTDTVPSATALHLPLVTPSGCIGIVALAFHAGRDPDFHQRNLLDAFASQVALVLDRQRLRDSERRTQLVAESERLGKALLNSVSHELRTPLAAISGAVAELHALTPASDPRGPFLAEIDEAASRLNRLVRNLLDVTRIESGHLRPRPDWCDVSDLVRAAVQESAPALRDHPLTTVVPTGLPLVYVDAVLLVQALHNLLVNAATHTPERTKVELSAEVLGRSLRLSVADRGPGIPEAELPRLFDRFFRGTSARPGGTGLGLAIAKGFTEANGGSLSAGNRPDGGAVFTIRLPIQDPPTLPSEAGE
jgi:two-component system, OmpR family, sensor histidine kinase KdpD